MKLVCKVNYQISFKLVYLYPPDASAATTAAVVTKNYTSQLKKFAVYLHREVSLSRTEINLILKNKMATTGIFWKIIYLFLLVGSHK